jgi:predicted hotdog family 3-hydroxylacyl-ACP dehydratase
MSASSSWPDVSELVPHTGVARFLTHIRSVTSSAIEATGRVPTGHALSTDGLAPSFLAIELGAQAAAAMEALARRTAPESSDGPARGSIVRIRDARFVEATFPVDAPIHIRVDLVGSAPPLAMYSLKARVGDRTLVEASFSTHAGDPGARA